MRRKTDRKRQTERGTTEERQASCKSFARIAIGKADDANSSPVSPSEKTATQILRPIVVGKADDTNPSPVSSSAKPTTQILRPYRHRKRRRRKSFARIVVGKAGDANPSPVSSSAKPASQILLLLHTKKIQEQKIAAGAPSSSRHCRHHTGTLPAQSTQTNSSFSSRAPEATSRGHIAPASWGGEKNAPAVVQ